VQLWALWLVEKEPGGQGPQRPGSPDDPTPHVGDDEGIDDGLAECSCCDTSVDCSGTADTLLSDAKAEDEDCSAVTRGAAPDEVDVVAV